MTVAGDAAGFDELAWGMSERQVKARYPKAKAGIAGIVVAAMEKLGPRGAKADEKIPITVRFQVEGGLKQIAVTVQRYYFHLGEAIAARDEEVFRDWVSKRAGIVARGGNEFVLEHAKLWVGFDLDGLCAFWEPRPAKAAKAAKATAKSVTRAKAERPARPTAAAKAGSKSQPKSRAAATSKRAR